MSDDLATLETQRSKLLEEFLGLGDLRPGSVTAVTRRCGKSSCHCAKHNDPGHDPQFRLTRRIAGKTVTESFPNPIALRKAQQEVAEFHRFQQLSQNLVALNEQICRLRPVARERGGWTEQEKKTAAAIHQEVAREVNQVLGRVFAQRRKDGRTDLEAVESALRAALHQAGAAALSQVLQFAAPAADERQLPCPCGHHARYQEIRSKPLLTIVGPVLLSRPYYLCSQCHVGQFPVDVELDIENTEFSPGVRRMHALVGQQAPFDHGREQMQVLAGLTVTTKSVERIAEAMGSDIAWREQAEIDQALQLDLPVLTGAPIPVVYVQMDGTGIPVVKKETVGRPGKRDGQPAHTREVKLGCVFTQTRWDEKGFALRDPDSTTYTGAIETAEEFGKRIYREALQRGWSRARKKVVIGDGAEWIWNLVAEHFPGAREIVDLYHARQHLWTVARQLYPQEEVQQKAWRKVHQKRLLDKGKIEKLVSELHSIATTNPQLAEKIRTEAVYFERNAERMRYPRFRRQHLFVGSGVIEAGCKTVVGSRLKQSGMFWTVRGANAILALRCSHLNGRFEDYWEQRQEARAA